MNKFRKWLTCMFSLILCLSTLVPSVTVHAVTKSFQIGKQDPTEVIATVDSDRKTVTLTMGYRYSGDNPEDALPNPGYMSDQRQSELLSYMEDNNLTGYSLIIGSEVKSIGTNAFSGSSAFTTITVQSSTLEKIGANAFSNMSNLSSVDMSRAILQKIEPNTFSDNKLLKSIAIPSTVKTISSGAFLNTGIEVLEGGNNVVSVEANSFSGAKKIILDTSNEVFLEHNWLDNGYEEVSLDNGTKLHVVEIVPGLSQANYKVLVKDGDKLAKPEITSDSDTFEGWFEDEAFTKPFSFENSITASKKVYGKWHSNNVTITFDAQNNVASFQKTIAYGSKVEKPNDPVNGDKVFIGWFKDSGFVTPVNFDKDTFDKDTTLYAKYVDATYFTVTFDSNDGNEVASQTVKAGNTAFRPTDPEKDDYTFDGWYSDTELSKKWDFEKNTISSDITLYAKWKSNYITIKFETNGGGMIESQSIERGSTAKKPADPTKNNCEFLGWFADSGTTVIFNFEAKVNEDTTVYAGWNQTAYTVKFEANGGSAVPEVVTNPNTMIARPADPIKEGYHLEAWCSDSGLTTPWDFNSSLVTSDITLYAKWASGTAPGVTNTGAAVPQTGDPGLASTVSSTLVSTLLCGYLAYKRNKF